MSDHILTDDMLRVCHEGGLIDERIWAMRQGRTWTMVAAGLIGMTAATLAMATAPKHRHHMTVEGVGVDPAYTTAAGKAQLAAMNLALQHALMDLELKACQKLPLYPALVDMLIDQTVMLEAFTVLYQPHDPAEAWQVRDQLRVNRMTLLDICEQFLRTGAMTDTAKVVIFIDDYTKIDKATFKTLAASAVENATGKLNESSSQVLPMTSKTETHARSMNVNTEGDAAVTKLLTSPAIAGKLGAAEKTSRYVVGIKKAMTTCKMEVTVASRVAVLTAKKKLTASAKDQIDALRAEAEAAGADYFVVAAAATMGPKKFQPEDDNHIPPTGYASCVMTSFHAVTTGNLMFCVNVLSDDQSPDYAKATGLNQAATHVGLIAGRELMVQYLREMME